MDFERKEVIPIEYMDKLKERVEEYLQENEISALAFCKLAQINELKFYLWINNNINHRKLVLILLLVTLEEIH